MQSQFRISKLFIFIFINNLLCFVKVPCHVDIMPVLADDSMLILLQCRQLASGALELDEEHATGGREEHAVRHASATR